MGNSVRCDIERALECYEDYPVKTLVTAVMLPTRATEIAINTENLRAKLEYILNAYDSEMRLKTNTAIVMTHIMIVH